MITFLSIVFLFICLILIFLVVITPSNEGGIAAAFGGMGSDSFFGTKAHSHINKTVVVLSVLFLVLAVAINLLNMQGGNVDQEKLDKVNPPAPVAPAPAGTTPPKE